MGILRTMLALSVLFVHAYEPIFTDGKLAVQIFFLISGYLISFILHEIKAYSSTLIFYKNRLLRIFPLYFCISAFSLLVYLAGHIFFDGWVTIDRFIESTFFSKLFLVFTNTFIVGQDLISFIDINFINPFNHDEKTILLLDNGLLVPPSWTIALELYFYLLAPFILRNKYLLIGLFFSSLIFKFYFLLAGVELSKPFEYQFFPMELSIFLLGAVSHQYISPKVGKFFENLSASKNILLLIFLMQFLIFNQLYNHYYFSDYIIILAIAFFLPFLFQFQKTFKIDRKIGALSYPIYLSHWIIIIIVSFFMPRLGIENEEFRLLIIVIMTILVSFLLNELIEKRFEEKRKFNKLNS